MMEPKEFTVDIIPLNSAEPFNSNASGSATLTLEAPSENIRTLQVDIEASGLQDLSEFGGIHVAHIHGQFEGNASRPLLEQGDGAFFDGEGGTAVSSILPQLETDDLDGDGFLNFLEGRPSYGPVILNLTSTEVPALEGGSFPPEGTPPLNHFLNLAEAGEINPAELFPSGTEFNLDTTYTFDLDDPDQLRQFNNLTPLEDREIVLHGLTVPSDISDAIDEAAQGTAPAGVDLDNGESFRLTAPVAAGVIENSVNTEVPNEDLLPDISLEVNSESIFNESLYLNQNPDVANALEEGLFNSGFEHFLAFGLQENRIPTTVLQNFNANSYLNENPDVNQAVEDNTFQSALDHFLSFGFKEERDGSDILFEESFYLNQNSDVLQAVEDDILGSGFEHFAIFGFVENRAPTEDLLDFDAESYLGANPDVEQAVQQDLLSSALEHRINFGAEEGRDLGIETAIV